jgi:hypothetical protein
MVLIQCVNKRLIFLQLTFVAFVLNFLQKKKLENLHTPSKKTFLKKNDKKTFLKKNDKKTFLKKNDKKNFSRNQWFNIQTHLKPLGRVLCLMDRKSYIP